MKGKQKILMVSEYFYPHWTGLAVSFRFYAEQLIQMGQDVTMLCVRHDRTSPIEDNFNDIKIIRSNYTFRLSRTHYSYKIIFDFWKMVNEYDTIIINSPNSNIFFFSILSKIYRKKLIIWHQGDLKLAKNSGNQLFNFAIMRIFDVFTIGSMWLADIISTYTLDYATSSRVMKYFSKKTIAYIPPIVLTANREIDKDFQSRIKKYKKDHLLVGFAGRFVEEKGFDILLQAIPIVVSKIPNVMFLFAGSTKIDYENTFGNLSTQIVKLSNNLQMLGLLDAPELIHFNEEIDLFVLSSRSDCFPLTQIDAVKTGTPSVCTDIPGAKMLVIETEFGETVKTEDANSLAQGIIKVLKNLELYKSKQSNIKIFFEKYASPPSP